MRKTVSKRSIKPVLLTISPLSLKHLAKQRSPGHGALVSQQPQSLDAFFVLLGQSGMSVIAPASAGVYAAIAVATGASVTPTAISTAIRKRRMTKAYLPRHLSPALGCRVK